jgi:ribosomal protein S24E
VKLYTPSNKFNYRFIDYKKENIDCDWIRVDILQKNGEDEDNALVLHIEENNGDKRRVYLKVYNDDDFATLTIYQESGVIMHEENRK